MFPLDTWRGKRVGSISIQLLSDRLRGSRSIAEIFNVNVINDRVRARYSTLRGVYLSSNVLVMAPFLWKSVTFYECHVYLRRSWF